MAITTPNMALKCWNLTTDAYNNQDLVDNFARVDQHDHSNGKGVQITGPGIASGQITSAHLAPGALSSLPPNSVGSGQLSAGSVTAPAIATGAVGTTALATGAVTAATIASQAVGTAALAPSSVTSAIIASGAVGLSDLGSDVTGALGLSLQSGVFYTASSTNGDGYIASSPTVTAGSGAITFTTNGGFCMIGSPLVRAAIPSSSQTLTPGTLPGNGNFRAVAVDMVAPATWGGTVTFTTSVGTSQASLSAALGNAPALVSGRVRLIDAVLTYNGTSYSLAGYRDRRPWASGARSYRFDGDETVYNIVNSQHEGAVRQRIECSGAPILVVASVGGVQSPQSGAPVFNAWPLVTVDYGGQSSFSVSSTGILGTAFNGVGSTAFTASQTQPGQTNNLVIQGLYTPSAGSHIFSVGVAANNASGGAQYGWGPYSLSLMELPGGSANNGTS